MKKKHTNTSNLEFISKTDIIVKLEKKTIGKIKEVKGGWQYHPKGSPQHKGEIFTSQFGCMESLIFD